MSVSLGELPERLDRLVEVQPGSVVSRMLLKNKSGSVTMFAFDQGEGLSEHTVPFDALLMAVSGEAAVRIADTEHRISKGEILHLPAGIPHSVRPESPFRMLLIMLKE
ncbi:MAG: cupin domain-containing protein [Bacteroidota bacterium]